MNNLRLLVVHHAMLLQKWLLESDTMACRQIFGLAVSFSMPWSRAIYPLRTQRRRTCTRKLWLLITRCQSFFHQSARTSFRRSWTQTQRLVSEFQTFETTPTCAQLTKKRCQSLESLAFSLECRKCPFSVSYSSVWSTISNLKKTTQSVAWKQIGTITSLLLTTS